MTKWMDYCMICGHPTEEKHHALYGNKHKLADEDHLIMPLCAAHHKESNMSIHKNKEMKALSQMLAEVCWERQYLAKKLSDMTEMANKDRTDAIIQEAKDSFKDRYGEYYL